ncbi:hypothetical protein GJAV_G00111880 [Gymnothorax javanicus]|nr:hypothetical protein GJAV_G00111880 [Gymnothorax javanicus]
MSFTQLEVLYLDMRTLDSVECYCKFKGASVQTRFCLNKTMLMDRAMYLYLLHCMFAVSAVRGSCPAQCLCEEFNQVQCQGETVKDFPSFFPPNTTYIFIAYTNIISLKPGDFDSCAQTLRNVSISYSAIAEILDGTFNNTHRLEVLTIRGTKVEDIQGELFKNLKALQRLRLDRNNIMTLSQETFRGLGQLKSLDLSHNSLSTILDGIFDDLENLQELYLSQNHIKDLPAELFSKLHKLQKLYLSRNCISVLPEGIFTNLLALTELSLFGNCLKSLSVGVFGSMPLQKLWLYNNKLTRLEDDVFQNLTSLHLLDLSGNQIDSVSVRAFRGLSALRELSLHTNELVSLPEGAFSGLTSLDHVSLQNNHLWSLPGRLLHGLPRLRHLDLHNNSLPSLPRELLASLESAAKVLLIQNPWQCDQDIVPLRDWLRLHFSKVEDFSDVVCHLPASLSGTRIDYFDRQPTKSLKGIGEDIRMIIVAVACTLTIAILVGVIFFRRRREAKTSPPKFYLPARRTLSKMATRHFHLTIFILLQLCFHGCSCPTKCVCFTPTRVFCADEDLTEMPRNLSINVKEMVIMTTGITQLQPSAFPKGSKLFKLVFLNNLLKNVSQMTFNKLEALQELEISGNQGLDELYVGTLSELVNLTTLVLNFNNFKVLQWRPFHTLRKLETLELKGNILEDLTDDLFEELGRLRLLDLSLNKISKVRRELFRNLSQLRTLKLDYNRIDMLPNDTFDGVPRLRELTLQGNRIARLPQALFTRLIELEKLNLRGNLIEDLAAASFPPRLVELNLVKNRLVQLPPATFQGLSRLTCLLLSKNQLSVLQEDLLRNLTALEHLDLSDNLIDSLPEATFEGLSELEVLHLENNNISRLHSGLFKDQEYLQQLYLSNNTLENIPATLFDSFLDHGLIRLHNNPWTCDCHLIYLHDWLRKAVIIIPYVEEQDHSEAVQQQPASQNSCGSVPPSCPAFQGSSVWARCVAESSHTARHLRLSDLLPDKAPGTPPSIHHQPPPHRPSTHPSHPVTKPVVWTAAVELARPPRRKTSATHAVPAWSGPSSQPRRHMFPSSRVHGPNPPQHGFNLNLPTTGT